MEKNGQRKETSEFEGQDRGRVPGRRMELLVGVGRGTLRARFWLLMFAWVHLRELLAQFSDDAQLSITFDSLQLKSFGFLSNGCIFVFIYQFIFPCNCSYWSYILIYRRTFLGLLGSVPTESGPQPRHVAVLNHAMKT
jgi:hypothetical protein